MSLDVYLEIDPCAHCGRDATTVFTANITHNLNLMAEAAGIYMHLWRPDEIAITKAEQLIEPLERGLRTLTSDPQKFLAFEPSNGWGSHAGLVRFVTEYLEACRSSPALTIRVCR